jgi:hypothetical protein
MEKIKSTNNKRVISYTCLPSLGECFRTYRLATDRSISIETGNSRLWQRSASRWASACARGPMGEEGTQWRQYTAQLFVTFPFILSFFKSVPYILLYNKHILILLHRFS